MSEEPVDGRFLVTHVDDGSAVLRDVETARIHAVADPPALSPLEVLDATLAPGEPLDAVWRVEAVDERRTIPVERSEETPTRRARRLAAECQAGDLVREERAGEGELHVLSVPEGETEAAAADVLEDEETVARAARLGVERVEVRAAEGVLSVRYLP